jgi:glycosyltransferase involved in cell wall biosynthesis
VARSGGSTSPESTMVNALEWWGSYEASKVITISRWMQEHISTLFNLPPSKIEVIPNGIDVSKFEGHEDGQSVRRELKVGPAESLITSVGRMTPQKGFDNLLKAFPRILEAVPDSRLLIIGDGYMRDELESLAKREGVAERTLFPGFLNDEQMISALKSSNVVVVPSRFEPFGITALEAMAAGTPVVVAGVGGLAEIIADRVDGIQVDPNKPESIAEGVVRMLSDARMASGFARRAKEKVRTYNWGTVAEATLRVYEQAARDVRYE